MELISGKTLSYGISGETFIQAHIPGPPDEKEWADSVVYITNAGASVKSWLVYADGTQVNAAQRKMLNNFYTARGAEFRTGLLTDSTLTRTVINLINTMVPSAVIKAYPVEQLNEALDYTNLVGAMRRQAARDLLMAMRALRLPLPPASWSVELDDVAVRRTELEQQQARG